MGKHLVLVGAGHAHMTALMRAVEYLDKGHQVTVISPYAYHYYSGMGPVLAGLYQLRAFQRQENGPGSRCHIH
jgi:NADH dehydrogenase FAD-containing subunit